MLLCHGFTGSPNSMRPWARYLADRGYTVRLPRLPGHGTRWQEANLTRWSDWFGEVDRSLEELAGRCRTVFVCGLSMGGTLALRLAEVRGTTVTGLVLVNPSVTSERFAARYLLPLLGRVLPAWASIGNDINKPGVDEVAYTKVPLKAALSLRELWDVTRTGLPTVEQPLLLFRSRVDHVVEAVNSEIVRTETNSADLTEVVLERSWHVATLDYDAEEIFDRSAAWIAERSGGSHTAPPGSAGHQPVDPAPEG